MNICYCGTQAGYPHDPDCPRPLYRATQQETEKWERERRERHAALVLWAILKPDQPINQNAS